MPTTVIRGGTIVDGTGAPGHHADVVIDGDRISSVGSTDSPAEGPMVIDATGLTVAPGFIDLHTHADYTVLAFPSADSALRQGVTTIAVGNCGGGVAPISEQHDIRDVAFAFKPEWGISTSWRAFPEYLARLGGLGVNVAAMVPHGALRNSVMGVVPRPATDVELDLMCRLLDEALEAGAVGMSTGLQYRPGCWAPFGEIRTLVEVVGRRAGIYATHMRNRSDGYVAAIQEALAASAGTGAHLQLSHVAPRPNARPEEVDRAFELLRSSESGRFGVDTFPEPWGPGLLVDLFPTELMEGETGDVLARLRDRSTRAEMVDFIDDGRSFLARVDGYGRIFLSFVPNRPELTGLSLGTTGSVGEFCCDLLEAAGDHMREIGIRHIYAEESAIDEIIRMPFCSLASDGIVTPGEGEDCPLTWSASSYGFTARLLEHYVRERELLTLEDAVRRLTQLPAQALGLDDRGVIAAGKKADLVIFDPTRVRDRSTPDDMNRHPSGIETVIVNGAVAANASGLTTVRSGQLVA